MKKMILMAIGAVMLVPFAGVAQEQGECVLVENGTIACQSTELDQLIDDSFEMAVSDLLPMVLEKVITTLRPYFAADVDVQEVKEKIIQAVIDALYESKKDFVAFMKDHYTLEEIRQIIDYQGSSACQKMMKEVFPPVTAALTIGIGLRLQHLAARYIENVQIGGALPEVVEDVYALVVPEKRAACENMIVALQPVYEHIQQGLEEAKAQLQPYIAEEKREQFEQDLANEWVMIQKMMTQDYLKAFSDCCTVNEMNEFIAHTQTDLYKKSVALAELQKNIFEQGLEQKIGKIIQENAALFVSVSC